MAEEKGGERRPTTALGSSGSKGAGPMPVNPNDGQSPLIDADKDAIIARLHKQVDEKTTEIGQLCTEVVNFRQKLDETEAAKDKIIENRIKDLDESSGKVGELEEQLASVLAELRAAKADAGLFDGRIKELETRLTAASIEKVKLAQELAAARVANPESEFEKQAEEYSIEAGRLKIELDFTKKARAETEKLVEELKAEIEKINADNKTELATFENETTMVTDGLKRESTTLRQQLNETRRKYYDALAGGSGLSDGYLKQIDALRQELASMHVRAEKAQVETERANKAEESVKKTEADCLTALRQEKKLTAAEAGWFADGASNGATRQPTTDQMAAAQVAKPNIVQRLFGRKSKEE